MGLLRLDINGRKDEIINLFNTKKSISAIAKLMDCDFCVIKRILQENNIQIRPIGRYRLGIEPTNKIKLDEEEIIKFYKSGMSLIKITNHFINIKSMTPIYRILKENNVTMRPKGFQQGHEQLNSGRTHFKKGESPWNKDKVFIKMIGNTNGFKKGNVSWNTGLTKEINEKLKNISLLRKNKTYEEEYGIERAREIKEKIKEARAKQIIPMIDTLIELKIQNFLKQLNIDFLTHQYISKINHSYQCDILINPQPNFMAEKKTIIEVDGDYWHGNPSVFKKFNELQLKQIEEDACRNEELRVAGFDIIRIWECDIKKMNLEDFKEILLNKIKQFV